MPIPSPESNAEPRLTAKERIYNTLLSWIVDGVLQPEEKISDLEISKYFAVSRTPVREAMQLLADQKLVEIFPGKESRVAPIDAENTRQAYVMLAQLHALAVQFAFPKIDDGIIRELEAHNQPFKNDEKNPELSEIRARDKAFHEIFLRLAGNDFLANFSNTLYIHVTRTENLYYSVQRDYLISLNGHASIIEALKNRDLEGAMEAMKYNWLHTAEVIDMLK